MASIARGIIGGIAGAAGDPNTQQQMVAANQQAEAQKQNELKAKIAPLGLAIKNLQTGVQSAYGQYQQAHPEWQGDFDTWKTGPGSQQFNQFVDQTQGVVHSMRELLHPDHQSGPTDWLKTHLTDRAHITNADHRAEDQANDQAWNKYDEGQFTQKVAGGVQGNPLSPQEQTQAAKIKAGLTPKDTTEQERFVSDYMKRNPTAKPEDALKVYRDATSTASAKAPKGMKAMEQGGVAYGIEDQDTGKQYLVSQLGPDGNAPPEAKQIFATIKQAQQQKRDDAEAKDRERDHRFLESQAAIASRMGRTEEWQAKMADYREGLGAFKKIDDQANATQEMASNYKAQYADPATDKSAVDTQLVADYTGLLARGGRKNKAEYEIARNIGSFKLNAQQWLKKKTSGELPDELRKMYVDYINSAADTQRQDADSLKPDPPTVGHAEGPKTKQLQASRASASGKAQHQVGETRKFPNGKTGVWDGQGWVAQ